MSAAEKKGVSNCPKCTHGTNSNRAKIWPLKDMEADHVTPWSKGNVTTAANCEMLCKPHNRTKGTV